MQHYQSGSAGFHQLQSRLTSALLCVPPFISLLFAMACPASSGRTLQAAKLVLEKDGILGLWRGTTPTIARSVKPRPSSYRTARLIEVYIPFAGTCLALRFTLRA